MTGTKVPNRTARYAANVTSRDTGMVVVNACVSSDDHPKGLRGLYLLKMQDVEQFKLKVDTYTTFQE